MILLFIGEAPNARGIGRGLNIYFFARALGQGPEYLRAPRPWLREFFRREGGGPLARALLGSRHVNLLDEYPGSDGRGARFPLAPARERARALALDPSWSIAVLVGRRVATALDLPRAPLFTRQDWGGRPAWIVPHTSGLSQTWNDPSTARMARSLLEKLGAEMTP